MEIQMILNGKEIQDVVSPDMLLIDFVRKHGGYSVKRGCETSNCGLCTVFLDGKPILSCSILVGRAAGHCVETLEGLQEEASSFVGYIADQGAEQCGFCNSGLVMNTIALLREKQNPSDEEIRDFLAGNLCRCSGYEGQLRGIRNFLNSRAASLNDRASSLNGKAAGLNDKAASLQDSFAQQKRADRDERREQEA